MFPTWGGQGVGRRGKRRRLRPRKEAYGRGVMVYAMGVNKPPEEGGRLIVWTSPSRCTFVRAKDRLPARVTRSQEIQALLLIRLCTGEKKKIRQSNSSDFSILKEYMLVLIPYRRPSPKAVLVISNHGLKIHMIRIPQIMHNTRES